MNSICVATGCLDVQTPIKKISFKKLYQWPESEAEFLNKLIITMNEGNSPSSTSTSTSTNSFSCSAASPSFSHQNKPSSSSSSSSIDHHESFVCRQKYLKSYTFSKQKETMTEKTKRWIKEKQRKKKKKKKNRNIHHHHHEEKSKDHEKYGFDHHHHHHDINGGSGSSNPCSSTFKSAFLFLLSCMVKVDVHDE